MSKPTRTEPAMARRGWEFANDERPPYRSTSRDSLFSLRQEIKREERNALVGYFLAYLAFLGGVFLFVAGHWGWTIGLFVLAVFLGRVSMVHAKNAETLEQMARPIEILIVP